MGIFRTETVDLSDDDVNEAITYWLDRKYGARPEWKVTIDVITTMEGFGINERHTDHVAVSATRKLP